MDNKIQNIVLKSLVFLIIGLGILMTFMVMNDDDPNPMKIDEQQQWAIKEYNGWLKEKGIEKEVFENGKKAVKKFLTYNIIIEELTDQYDLSDKKEINKLKEGIMDSLSLSEKDLKNVLQDSDVNKWKVYRTGVIVKEKKKKLKNDVSNVIFFTRILLILAVCLVLASFIYILVIDYVKGLKILAGILALVLFVIIIYYIASDIVPTFAECEELDEECKKFTPYNWKISSAAILSSLTLLTLAIIAVISGSVMKLFR